jgi:hypothetical protein
MGQSKSITLYQFHKVFSRRLYRALITSEDSSLGAGPDSVFQIEMMMEVYRMIMVVYDVC